MSKPLMITVLAREPEPARFERDGVVRDYFKQWASVEVDGLVNSFEFSSDEPVQPGPATLDPRSFSITNGRLALGRVKLVPLAGKPAPTLASPTK